MSGRKKKDEPPREGRGLLLSLQKGLCRGCTHCIRVCPTEAIRVRKGKAEVIPHRCIQCGQCIWVCPREAWTVQADSLSQIKEKNDNACAVLDSVVFGQFGDSTPPLRVIQAFRDIGFSSVREMGESLEIYRGAVSNFLSSEGRAFPAISSDCPAVVQLVQVKFPSLIENLVPIIPPYEIMAHRLKEEISKNSMASFYYIVPCLAKAHAAIRPLSAEGGFSGAVPLADLYNPLKGSLHQKNRSSDLGSEENSSFGLEWAYAGGESKALGILEASLVVDGIRQVVDILELAENGLLGTVPFIEAWSCPGGCLGGALNVQNPYLAKFHLQSGIRKYPSSLKSKASWGDSREKGLYRLNQPWRPREGMRLDEDLKVAMEKLRCIDGVVKKFPGIDCGSCGCPNCLALAEDVVQGYASENDCIYMRKGTKGSRSKRKERP